MKSRLYIFCLLLFFLGCRSAHSGQGCFPTDREIIPEEMNYNGITRTQFDHVLDTILLTYGPEVRKLGFRLVVNRMWSSGVANANTTTEGTDWVINAYGGLARKKDMTEEAFMLVNCHELGHHLGGAPRYALSEWPASVEGEADYWATLVCMKRLRPHAIERASVSLATVLARMEGVSQPSVYKRDERVRLATFEDHPTAQCRLDTYLAGAYCNAKTGPMSEIDPRVNSCFDYPTITTSTVGSRPRCWFQPSDF